MMRRVSLLLCCLSVTLFSCGKESSSNEPINNAPPTDNQPNQPSQPTDPTPEPSSCEDGKLSGDVSFKVEKNDQGSYVVTVDDENGMLGFFVTDPNPELPQPSNGFSLTGKDYWSVQSPGFAPFFGPVTYQVVPEGAIDSTAEHGGIAGGMNLTDIPQGTCLTFSVVSMTLESGSHQVIHKN